MSSANARKCALCGMEGGHHGPFSFLTNKPDPEHWHVCGDCGAHVCDRCLPELEKVDPAGKPAETTPGVGLVGLLRRMTKALSQGLYDNRLSLCPSCGGTRLSMPYYRI